MRRFLLATTAVSVAFWTQMSLVWSEEDGAWPVHVFVLQKSGGGSSDPTQEIHKAGPDELINLSRLFSLKSIPSDQFVLPLPEKILLLDAFEFLKVGRKRVKQRNPLLKLDYSISCLDLASPVRSFRLKGRSGRLKFDRTLTLERGKVHLVQFSAGLYFVLTPDRSHYPTSFDETVLKIKGEVEMPRLITRTIPEFPKDARIA